jgi:hypothetical protein
MKITQFPGHEGTSRESNPTELTHHRPLALFSLLLALCASLWLGATTVHADDPSFATQKNFGTGLDETLTIAVGDMDGDGNLDIVVGNAGLSSRQNVVYLNDGSGNFDWFGSARYFGTGGDDTRSVAVGDMDGDGDLDIATGNSGQQNVVYLNDGTGHFPSSSARSFGPGSDSTNSLALGDLDGDGDLDVVAGNEGQQNMVYLNDGIAHLGNARIFGPENDSSKSVALGDLNGDGYLDIAVGNSGSLTKQNVVYLNDGAANFDNPSSARIFGSNSESTNSVAVGDMDGDGDLDIVTGNDNQQNVVYLNDSLGNFDWAGSTRSFGTGSDSTSSIALGDIDSDGDLDVVVGNASQQNMAYLNDGYGDFTGGATAFGTGSDGTLSMVVADMDADGDLDLLTGNGGQQNVVYLNNGAGNYVTNSSSNFGTGSDGTWSVALGDVDGDGYLDLVTGNDNQQNAVYLNDGAGNFSWPGSARNFGTGSDTTYSVALGDIDNDDDLDIVTGNDGEQSAVYLNDGAGNFPAGSARYFGTDTDSTLSAALGDVNGDGYLDIVTGNGEQNVVYLNDGTGRFDWSGSARFFGTGTDETWSVAVGDVDSDGDLDIATGNGGLLLRQNIVYLNDGSGDFDWPGSTRPVGISGDRSWSVALGDIDGDGDLDIITGNYTQQNVVYLNDGRGHFDWLGSARNFGTGGDLTFSVALGDLNGDGSLDIIAGNYGQNVVYLNDGSGQFPVDSGRSFGVASNGTYSVAAGDVDGDGDLDLVAGNSGQNLIGWNRLVQAGRLPNNPPAVAISRPGPGQSANFISTPVILGNRFVPISFSLFDPEGDQVGRIVASYSLDGGGRWQPAVAADGTPLTDLETSKTWPATGANTHVFVWDTFASGLFGQSDAVVFRIEAYPQRMHRSSTHTYSYVNTVPGPFQRPYASAVTYPFRVRGTQVRVLSSSQPVSNALVYRLPYGQTTGGALLADNSGEPFRTDRWGYLQGRGTIAISDTLVAMLPISATDTYTLYHTSAAPTPVGLNAYNVSQAGVQTLTVSSAHPLMLFNLDVALEWDARTDERFMSQLNFDLQRASEIVYDWTNGQAALGQVNLYQNREKWLDAHVRIYATNRMRPNASQGGIVSQIITDPVTSTLVYAPGQIHMSAVWNRYGEPDGKLSEDWPRTLAHELGHYALFLDDNYLGMDAEGLLIPVDTCPGAMSDPYRDDDALGYGEFHYAQGWEQDCGNTLAAQTSGRWDWRTITTFYPWLDGITTNAGPSGLSLAVTNIRVVEPVTPSLVLETSVFHLTQDGGRVQPGSGARAFLFQGDHLLDLGRPTLDQVQARGARPGDRLCVYELAAGRLGCETVTTGDEELALLALSDWQPEVIVSPVNSSTVGVGVSNVPPGLALQARFFSRNGPAPTGVSLTPAGTDPHNPTMATYSGTLSLDEPALEGYVHVWVVEPEPRRESVVDYTLGGNPGRMWGRLGRMWGRLGRMWGRLTPAVSADGQVILFGRDLDFEEGEFFALQAVTVLPSPPAWATAVGQAYRLTTSDNAPDLSGTSLTFNYLGNEVPPGEESWLRVYYWNGSGWQPLSTRLDTYYNIASAATVGEGVYALMSSLQIPLYGPGWNNVPYPVQETRPVAEALLSVSGYYTTVYSYDPADDPSWTIYDAAAPQWINDLEIMEFGHAYWILARDTVTWFLKGSGHTSLGQILAPDAEAQAATSTAANVPATYYGAVEAGTGFTPRAGLPVVAWINGESCGTGRTQEIAGEIVYSVKVLPDGLGGASGCGTPGKSVWFTIGNQLMEPYVAWENDHGAQARGLQPRVGWSRPPTQVFLPILSKSQ